MNPNQIVIFVDQADLRVKTGTFLLKGRVSSVPQGGVHLNVHAGGPDGEMLLEEVPVDAQGNWECRGRALRSFAEGGFVTLVFPQADEGEEEHAHKRVSRTVPLRPR